MPVRKPKRRQTDFPLKKHTKTPSLLQGTYNYPFDIRQEPKLLQVLNLINNYEKEQAKSRAARKLLDPPFKPMGSLASENRREKLSTGFNYTDISASSTKKPEWDICNSNRYTQLKEDNLFHDDVRMGYPILQDKFQQHSKPQCYNNINHQKLHLSPYSPSHKKKLKRMPSEDDPSQFQRFSQFQHNQQFQKISMAQNQHQDDRNNPQQYFELQKSKPSYQQQKYSRRNSTSSLSSSVNSSDIDIVDGMLIETDGNGGQRRDEVKIREYESGKWNFILPKQLHWKGEETRKMNFLATHSNNQKNGAKIYPFQSQNKQNSKFQGSEIEKVEQQERRRKDQQWVQAEHQWIREGDEYLRELNSIYD